MATRSKGVISTLTGPWISAKTDVPDDGSNLMADATIWVKKKERLIRLSVQNHMGINEICFYTQRVPSGFLKDEILI